MTAYSFVGAGADAWMLANAAAEIVERDGSAYLRAGAGAVWLREPLAAPAFRLRTRARSLAGPAFVGVAFHGRDEGTYELVYASVPSEPGRPADAAQYDPVLNGSNTWQLFYGANHRAAAPLAPGEWLDLAVEVAGGSADVWLNGERVLRVPRLQVDEPGCRIGLWSYLPAEFATFEVTSLPDRAAPSLPRPVGASWLVAPAGPGGEPVGDWRECAEDETGLLNLNRALPFASGATALARAEWESDRPYSGTLRLGYSDDCQAYWNGEQVHSGEWRWAPARGDDGRVRLDREVAVPVRAGRNTLVVRVGVAEQFGWGVGATLAATASRVSPR